MTEERRESVAEVFTDVIEKMAFMFGETAEDGEFPTEFPDGYKAQLSFSGHADGTLILLAPQTICAELAANMLGVDEDEVDASAAADALGELLNVLCGNLLTKLAGSDPIFDLAVPSVNPAAAHDWTAVLERPDAVAFLVDDQPLIVGLAADKL